MKKRLAELIVERIKANFQNKFISQNLINTISIYETENGWAVDIPAECYDITEFNKKGVVVYNGKGSYAQAVNKSGGFSKSHKNYVEKAINEAIAIWKNEQGIKGKVSKN